MIRYEKVEVTCDGRNCNSNEFIDLEWKHFSYSGESGYYDADDDELDWVEDKLKGLDWVCTGELHFCCQDCYERSTEG